MKEGDRFTLGLTAFAIALVAVLMIFESPGTGPITEYKSKKIARRFVKSSPTYSFDGYGLKYEETLYPDTRDCKECYTFLFKFKSKHAGYGNRSGKMLAQVITPHKARVRVTDGGVTSANLDGKWDILGQEMVEKVSEEFCGWSTNESCFSDSDCIMAGCSGQVCDATGGKTVVTTCEWRGCYNATKYNLECRCVQGECKWN